jgi:hypothetical protein
MKKFYTLALAAATVLSASAFDISAPKAGTRVMEGNPEITKNFNLKKGNLGSLKETTPGVDFSKMSKKAKAPAKVAPAKSDFVNSLYEQCYYYYDESASSYWSYYELPSGIYDAGENATEGYDLVIYSFWQDELGALAAYDESTGTLSIPMQPIAQQVSNGTTYTFYFAHLAYDEEQDGFVIPEEDFQLTATEDKAFTNNEDYWAILYTYEGASGYGIYDLCASMYMEFANSMVEYSYVDEDTNEPYSVYRYQYATYDNSALTITNLLGYGQDVEFVIDADAKTATATNQLFYSYNGSVYYVGDADGNKTLVCEVMQNSDGEYKIFYTETLAVVASRGSAVAVSYDEFYFVSDIDLLTGAGVKNVSIDNSNAPVEYFNLQGVKVENPSNGIFIRRQGTQSSKVLVK